MPDTLDTLIKQLEEKRIELRVISGMFDRFDPDYHKKEKKRVIGDIANLCNEIYKQASHEAH